MSICSSKCSKIYISRLMFSIVKLTSLSKESKTVFKGTLGDVVCRVQMNRQKIHKPFSSLNSEKSILTNKNSEKLTF